MANKKQKDLSPDADDSLKKVLQAVEDALNNAGPLKSPAISADEDTKKKLNEVLAEIVAARQFAAAIAQGDLSQNPDVKGYMAANLKTLQSNLRHLTWQAGQIAGGDLSQRVHFMGDFSDSFNTMVEHLSEEKTSMIKREEEERLTYERFKTLLKVSLMRDASETELSQYVMQAACRMTGSTLAFIGTMNPDESAMDIISWSKSAMQDCRVVVSPIHFPIEKAGIWAEAVRTRRIKIVNDYSAPHPGKKGLPEGHVRVSRFLSLPILENGKVVMVAAVANKSQDYDEADVTRLTLLMQGVWSNIRRRRTEEALTENEYRFRELFNSMNSGVVVLRCVNDGDDFEIVDFNHGAEIIENVKKQDVIGKCVSMAFPGVKEMGLMEIFRRVWRTGKSEHQPTSLYRNENASRWRENYVYRLPSMELVAIYDDVTERKQAEEAIKAAVKLNQLIDAMSVSEAMTYTLNEAERLTDSKIGFFHFVNPDEKTIQLAAWSAETRRHCYVPNKPDVNYPVSKAGVWVDCLRERKPIIHNDYAGLAHKTGLPKGHVPVTREIVVPIFEEDRIVAIIGVGNKAADYHDKDINVMALLAKNAWTLIRRKQTEEALRQSEQKFREIFDNANDGIAIIEILDNGYPGKYIDLNEVACSALQYTKEELLLLDPLEISTDNFSRSVGEIVTELKIKGHSRFEAEHIRKDKTVFPVEINTHIVTLLGKKVFLSAIRDITERKNAEKILREANNKLNMLSSITRHDILNMIMVIRGYLELSEDLEKEPLLLKYLEKEKEAIDAIQEQIEFTRYYEDIGLKEPTWHNAEKLADLAAKILDLKKIKFENLLDGLEIFADPLIEKVFYNLTENSLRHGGRVTSIGFSYSEKEDGLVISYHDNGAGISEEDKKKLFTKGFGKHTGLGLFLSREILSITNIKITENGTEGEGVNFEINIPKGSFRFVKG